MKLYRNGELIPDIDIFEDDLDTEYILSMSNLESDYHGDGFRFWLDDAGVEREAGHHEVRFKCDNGNQESRCIFVIPRNGSKIHMDEHTDAENKAKFKYESETIEFMEEFRDVLVMQYDRKITSSACKDIIKLVRMKHYSMSDAINTVLYQNIYDDIHSLMKDISDSNNSMKGQVTKACYYTPIEYVNADKLIVDAARRFIKSVDESYFNTSELRRYRNALITSIKRIDDLIGGDS